MPDRAAEGYGMDQACGRAVSGRRQPIAPGRGGEGADRLDDGGGDDTLIGGPGSDECDGADGHGDTADASCEQVDDVP